MTTADPRGAGDVTRERDYYRRLLDLGGRDELGPLLEDALALAVAVTGARVAYLELHDDEDGSAPRFWRSHGLDAGDVDAVRTSISRGIIARAIAAGETVETPSALEDARFADLGSVRQHAIQAVLCAPIGHPPLGVLYLQGRVRPGPFEPSVREHIELFARQLAPLADRLLASRGERGSIDHTREVRQRFRAPDLVGRSAAVAQVLQQAALVAPLDVDVLITGPSGTGKTALARAIAANSKRAAGPFVALNCAALPDALLESELFGAERGAHSTATRRAPGKVAAAEGGTLFLDEIGELSLAAQAKLLHLLQAREYHPLGATAAVRADVRMIFATNAELRRRVAERQFREDLFYRLHVLPIALPALAERRDDIAAIAERIVADVCQRHGFAPMTLARRALLACREASWPGNIRELAHALEAAVIRAHGDSVATIGEHHIFPGAARTEDEGAHATFHEATREFQRRYLRERLEGSNWNIAETARQLDLARSHVYTLIDTFRIERGNGS